jgi:hypothetical protein
MRLAEKKFTIVTPVYICNREFKGAEFGLCAARTKHLRGISQNKVINNRKTAAKWLGKSNC